MKLVSPVGGHTLYHNIRRLHNFISHILPGHLAPRFPETFDFVKYLAAALGMLPFRSSLSALFLLLLARMVGGLWLSSR